MLQIGCIEVTERMPGEVFVTDVSLSGKQRSARRGNAIMQRTDSKIIELVAD